MFWWTAQWMVIRWEESTGYYSHGWLVPLISGGLVCLKWKRIAACRRRPCRWGVVLVVASILLHLLATAWRVGFLSGFSLLGLLAGLVLSLFGTEVLRATAFPIAFLAFMIPLPAEIVEMISFRLKLLVAGVAAGFIRFVGVAARRDGSAIQILAGNVVVDDVCSGLKYLIALTAFGALYAHVSRLNRPAKALLFALSIPISFVANTGRVILMILIANACNDVGITEKWYAHELLGFLLFVVAFILLFGTESLLLKWPRLAAKKPVGPAEDPPAPDGVQAPPARPARRGRATPLAVFIALLVAAPFSLYLSWPRGTLPASAILSRIPNGVGSWRGFEQVLEERVYDILGTRDVLSRQYREESGRSVRLLIVLAQQLRRRTHPPERCFVGEGFTIAGAKDHLTSIALTDGTGRLKVRELILDRNDERRLVWYFYKSGSHLNTTYWLHQAGVALRKLREPDAADILIRVDTAVPEGGLEDAREVLADFLSEVFPPIMDRLP